MDTFNSNNDLSLSLNRTPTPACPIFITTTGEHAVRAMQHLDGNFFQGRIIHVMPSQVIMSHARHQEEWCGRTGVLLVYRDVHLWCRIVMVHFATTYFSALCRYSSFGALV